MGEIPHFFDVIRRVESTSWRSFVGRQLRMPGRRTSGVLASHTGGYGPRCRPAVSNSNKESFHSVYASSEDA